MASLPDVIFMCPSQDTVLRRAALQTEITSTLKAFYCTLCDKQFKTVAQYDEHTNSYAHHHKARFKDMQASQRIIQQEELDKRKEKERKREEKELRKMAAALGVKMAKPVAQPTPSTSSSLLVENSLESDPLLAKRSSWTTVSSSERDATQSGYKKTGWSTVGTSFSSNLSTPDPIVPSAHSDRRTPSFRTAGWTSLDAGATTSPLPQPTTHSSSSLPPTPPPPPLQEDNLMHAAWPSSPLDASPTGNLSGRSPSSIQPLPPPANRSSWQQFKQAGTKRRG